MWWYPSHFILTCFSKMGKLKLSLILEFNALTEMPRNSWSFREIQCELFCLCRGLLRARVYISSLSNYTSPSVVFIRQLLKQYICAYSIAAKLRQTWLLISKTHFLLNSYSVLLGALRLTGRACFTSWSFVDTENVVVPPDK